MIEPKNTAYIVFSGDINTRTGSYLYDKKIIDGLQELGWTIHLLSLDGDYPFPDATARQLASDRLAQIPDGSLVVADGLAFSVLPTEFEKHKDRLKLIALIHHPLSLETGLSDQQVNELKLLETQALKIAAHVISTSRHTAKTLSQFGVTQERVSVVFPGTESAETAMGSTDGQFRLICVATLNKRKGHAVLIDALKKVEHLPWQLTCAGSRELDPDTYKDLIDQTQTLGLSQRVAFCGQLGNAELNAEYQKADVFVLASYYEGYGMVLDEAIARALPIIATRGGAIADTVPSSAGILTTPGDSDELAEALRQFMEDEPVRVALQKGAHHARGTLRTWEQTSEEFAALLV